MRKKQEMVMVWLTIVIRPIIKGFTAETSLPEINAHGLFSAIGDLLFDRRDKCFVHLLFTYPTVRHRRHKGVEMIENLSNSLLVSTFRIATFKESRSFFGPQNIAPGHVKWLETTNLMTSSTGGRPELT